MKAELIDRQRAIDEFYMDTCDVDKVEWAESVLKRVPTAERKGNWIDIKCGSVSIWKCSECEEIFSENYHYCPNCGARMESE